MRSDTPKVLHPLCGRPMLLHVLDALERLPLERIVVVVGHGAEHVTKTLQEQLASEMPVEFVEQQPQRGTGDAVSVALTAFADDLDVDDDLHRRARRRAAPPGRDPRPPRHRAPARGRRRDAAHRRARRPHRATAGSCATSRGGVDRIVEQPDGTADELEINEVNPSIYCFRRGFLAPALRRLEPRERAGRVLPHRRRRRAAPGRATWCSASRPTTPEECSAATTAPSSPRPRPSCAAHQRPAGCAKA